MIHFDADAAPQLGLFIDGGEVGTAGTVGFGTSNFTALIRADANNVIDG